MSTGVKLGVGTLALFVLSYIGFHQVYLMEQRHHTGAALVASHPMPRLFDHSAVAPYATGMERQSAQATRLMQGWWSSHGTARHDREFAAWLRSTLPPPPSASARAAEAKHLENLARARTVAGTNAAQWLQTYGGRDVWAYYEQKQAVGLPQHDQHLQHHELGRMMAMSRKVGRALASRLQQSAPDLLDPALRQGAAAAPPGRTCPCSYPGAAEVSAAAGETFLGFLYPGQATQYQQLAEELGYAQLYMGNHLPSDVDAGALLGDMVGDYFLVTRGNGRPDQVAASR